MTTMGSTMLEKLAFRDNWVFVGQMGIEGHSTIEEVLVLVLAPCCSYCRQPKRGSWEVLRGWDILLWKGGSGEITRFLGESL